MDDETIEVETMTVACDGGSGALGSVRTSICISMRKRWTWSVRIAQNGSY